MRLVVEDGLPYRPARGHLGRAHRVFVPLATIQNWAEAGGKKAQARLAPDFLAWALATVSGYGAADALDDGPFCRLSVVDKRCDQRLLSAVLDHDPTHADRRPLLRRLHTAWSTRPLPLFGVTTDGAALSPGPLREVCGAGPPPIWTFPSVAAVSHAVFGAVASARQGLAAPQPQLRTGRPRTPAAKQAARPQKRLAEPRAALVASRSLCVQRPLNKTARQTWGRVSHGCPQLPALRALMEPG